MIAQFHIESFIRDNYKQSIMSQMPQNYLPNSALLTLTLNIDLLKVFQKNREIGIMLVSQYPSFYEEASNSIINLLHNEGYQEPEHGIHLLIKIINCPLPTQNISSPEFLAAAFEQKEGIMVYFPSATIIEIGQPQVYLFSCIEVWSPNCRCISGQNGRKRKKIHRNLIEVVKNSEIWPKKDSKKITQGEPITCQFCEKPYKFEEFTEQIYMNCNKIKIIIPKNLDSLKETKFTIFSSHELLLYSESKNQMQYSIGDQISCCCYIFCRPYPIRNYTNIGNQLIAKPIFKAFMISCNQICSKTLPKQPLIIQRSENNKFFSQLMSCCDLQLKNCHKLSEFQVVLQNYNNLIQQINLIKFPYLFENQLTVFKQAVLNSIFNLFCLGNNLSLMIVVEELQVITRAVRLNNLPIKFWPNDYDEITLKTWLISAKGSIVIVKNPSKKDLKILESYLSKDHQNLNSNYCITFWILSEHSIKKEIDLNYFGIVLDLTSEKNMNICKGIIDETIDLRLSAFLTDEEQQLIYTIPRIQNKKARISLVDTFKKEFNNKEQNLEQEHEIAQQILQKYYLKCRQLKKTAKITLNYLIKLAEGFSMMTYFFSTKKIKSCQALSLSILDAVLAIFLDQQSSRHKHSNANTIFGTDVSKLILNEKDCEISFWDYESTEEGTLREIKNYMPKDQMMKRMLYRLNQLLYQDQLLILENC